MLNLNKTRSGLIVIFGRLFSRQSHSESHETAPYFYQSMLIVNIIEVNYEENMKIVTFLKSLLINN